MFAAFAYAAPDPMIAITPVTRSMEQTGGTAAINTSGSGTWKASVSDNWILLTSSSGTAGYPVGYTVSANNNVETRIGYVYVSGYTHTITQSGLGATLGSYLAEFERAGGSGIVQVNAPSGKTWHAKSNASWITVSASSGTGTRALNFTVAPYDEVSTRSGTLTVADNTFTVYQTGRRMQLKSYSATTDYFAETIKIVWDNHWKKHPRLILVLCGSVSSWIRDNIVDNGAFVGRRSLDIVVEELPLRECAKFWGKAAGRVAARDMLDVLSVTGGVPRYLEEIDPSLDANGNIARLAFRPHGILRDDFDDMFDDVITRLPALSGRVLRTLVDGAKTVSDIAAALSMPRSGSISSVLECLAEAGLVRRDDGRNPETGEACRLAKFRLKDNYARFYLKYVEPVAAVIDDGSFEFVSMSAMPGWETILGLAFENLVVNNYRELLPHLHLEGTLITSAAPYSRKPSRDRPGCQVDLLLQSRRSLYFVEIKRKAQIGREAIEQVDSQVRAIGRRNGVSARTALVYEGELSPVVGADGYFDAIVPFADLLGARDR